jgi:hypothetical protein
VKDRKETQINKFRSFVSLQDKLIVISNIISFYTVHIYEQIQGVDLLLFV